MEGHLPTTRMKLGRNCWAAGSRHAGIDTGHSGVQEGCYAGLEGKGSWELILGLGPAQGVSLGRFRVWEVCGPTLMSACSSPPATRARGLGGPPQRGISDLGLWAMWTGLLLAMEPLQGECVSETGCLSCSSDPSPHPQGSLQLGAFPILVLIIEKRKRAMRKRVPITLRK